MASRAWGATAADFLWAVGIESTFVPHTRAGHRRLDEYELMDHYRLWRQDLDLAADLGISAIRYGIPWYRVNPKPGVFDWSWTDPVLDYMVRVKGLTPIVDLMHYGTPLWLDNHFVNASYPRRVAEYTAAFAERYGSLARFYTPMNEPGVTAAYCGRDGRWPPYLSGDDGYVKLLLALAKGVCLTAEALRSANPDAVLVHVEDVGLERALTPDQSERAALAQQRRLLPLDLVCGKVGRGHALHDWMIEHGASEPELEDLARRSPGWDVLGVNYYPWSNRVHFRRKNGASASSADPAVALGSVLRMMNDRYKLPMMITETSATGTHAERASWMAQTLGDVRQARTESIPIIGYTWFPMFSMIEWKYRWSKKGLEHHLLHLGLWDVIPREGRLDRSSTPLVDTYRRFAADGRGSIGEFIEPPRLAPLVELVA